jgi:hypothetical protein
MIAFSLFWGRFRIRKNCTLSLFAASERPGLAVGYRFIPQQDAVFSQVHFFQSSTAVLPYRRLCQSNRYVAVLFGLFGGCAHFLQAFQLHNSPFIARLVLC